MPDRTIAVGDIHGCSAAFDALINAIRPGDGDTVVTLGDYINRGPDSQGVLARLIDLGHRCRLIPLLGNHDQKLLEARTGLHPTTWLGMGGITTLDSYGPGRHIALIPDEHFAFLERCLDYHETASHIFIHANYAPDLPMAEQSVAMLRWESLRNTTPGPHASGKLVIVGHTSQKTGEILDLGHLICIDTCCHGGGWLTALEVGTGKIWQANRRGKLRQA
ncbi:metallophosphoesterase family protein [Singulisphaera sp. Ch08]|uniref:Metallophosphoesterase family protein n=1 Tax=Singulisphaera sp. Ch08 TaxID=3120278 RepID=A0AAU7CI87_9BACT